MALYKLGNDFLMWFCLTQGGTYILPAGQQGGSLKVSRAIFDASDKASGWDVNGPGNNSVSLNMPLVPRFPDTAYAMLQAAANSGPPNGAVTPIYAKCRSGGAAASDANTVFGAMFWVSGFGIDTPKNGALGTPFDFALADVPFVLPSIS